MPRLLGHLVKLRACELTLDEGGASCCLVVHGFATINSDQCFPFGDPIPVLDDPAVKALLRQRREAHRCPPRPSHHAPEGMSYHHVFLSFNTTRLFVHEVGQLFTVRSFWWSEWMMSSVRAVFFFFFFSLSLYPDLQRARRTC